MQTKCSVCSCEFSLDDEGGTEGYFGILPVAFCPTCLCCMEDMCEQLRGDFLDDPSYQPYNTYTLSTT